jgi:hypothetical protein
LAQRSRSWKPVGETLSVGRLFCFRATILCQRVQRAFQVAQALVAVDRGCGGKVAVAARLRCRAKVGHPVNVSIDNSRSGSMEGGTVGELLDVTVECPGLDQLQVEVGRTLENRVQPGPTGDDGEERHLHAVN